MTRTHDSRNFFFVLYPSCLSIRTIQTLLTSDPNISSVQHFFFFILKSSEFQINHLITGFKRVTLSVDKRNRSVTCICYVVVGYVSQPFYIEILISHLGRKICNALENVLRGCLCKNHPPNFASKIILPETLLTERLYQVWNKNRFGLNRNGFPGGLGKQ